MPVAYEHQYGKHRSIRLYQALKEGGYFILTDYFALSDEEEEMHRRNFLALKSEQGITDSEFYHYDNLIPFDIVPDGLYNTVCPQ